MRHVLTLAVLASSLAAPALAKFPETEPTTLKECAQDRAIWLRTYKGATGRDYQQQAIPTSCQRLLGWKPARI